MGDHTDAIDAKDPRWDSGGVDYEIIPPHRQNEYSDLVVKWLADFTRPIIDQCLVWHDGNHEAKFNKANSTSLSRRVLEQLFGVEDPRVESLYAPGQATTRIVFSDEHRHTIEVKLNTAHGNKTGQQVGTLINWGAQKLRSYDDVDIIMRGHHHHVFAQKVANVSNDIRHSRLRDRVGMVVGTGSALKTLQEKVKSYSEEADYLPVVLGFPRIVLAPERGRVRLEGRV
jgi:predicted phosphodiesterase